MALFGKSHAPLFVQSCLYFMGAHCHGHQCQIFQIVRQMVDEDISALATPRFVPMLVPPKDWVTPEQGGFLQLRSRMMRTKGEAAQKNALRRADLRKVYEGLNCLGKVRAKSM